MNKQELVAHIAQQAGITNTAAAKAYEAAFAGITLSLQQGADVRVPGFGTFSRGERAAREGRNPQTGEALKIAASYQAKFKPGKELKDCVNNKKKA